MPRFPEHFDGKRFFNPNGAQVRGFFDLLRWKLTTRPEPSAAFVWNVAPSKPPACIEGNELRVTSVNHSTLLLQQRGANILTDPIWSSRASPFKSLGPRRRREPDMTWEDLPRIDIVLLSHNHYDHLDIATLRRLSDRGQSQYVVPVGIGRFLQRLGIGPVHELDWGEALPWPTSPFTACLQCIFRHEDSSIETGHSGADS